MLTKLLNRCWSNSTCNIWKGGTNLLNLEVTSMISVRVKVRSDNNTVGKLAASEVLLCLLAVQNRVEFNEHFAHSRDFNPFNRPWDFHRAHYAIATALFTNILLDVFVFFIILQLLWCYLVEKEILNLLNKFGFNKTCILLLPPLFITWFL